MVTQNNLKMVTIIIMQKARIKKFLKQRNIELKSLQIDHGVGCQWLSIVGHEICR